MVSDLELAQVCWNLYYAPNKLNHIVEIDGVTLGVNYNADSTVICFRGSTTFLDWIRDFQALMLFTDDLGGVECGFFAGLRKIFANIRGHASASRPVYITGHSLGAARALIYAGLHTVNHIPIAKVTVFGSPRPGAVQLRDILKDVPVTIYRNGDDPVCEVPFDIPEVQPYVHVRDLTPVDVAPAAGDSWGIFARHHMDLYLKALQ